MVRAFATVVAVAWLAASTLAEANPKQPPDLFLISWKRSDGEWVFHVIPDNRWLKSTHSQLREFAAMTIEYETGIPGPDFFGTLQLYANTAQRIVWADYVGTRVTYPPRDIVDDIKGYAEAHHIHLSFERIKGRTSN